MNPSILEPQYQTLNQISFQDNLTYINLLYMQHMAAVLQYQLISSRPNFNQFYEYNGYKGQELHRPVHIISQNKTSMNVQPQTLDKEKILLNSNGNEVNQPDKQNDQKILKLELFEKKSPETFVETSQSKIQDFSGQESSQLQQQNQKKRDRAKIIEVKPIVEKKICKRNKTKDTKNIPKNFAKAIINYVHSSPELCQQFFSNPKDIDKFLNYLNTKKRKITNIKLFHNLINYKQNNDKLSLFNKVYRSIGYYFLKKNMISYIFNSKIQQQGWHLKYRRNIMRAFKHPELFNQVKGL